MSSFVPHLVVGVSVGLVSTGILGIHRYPDMSLGGAETAKEIAELAKKLESMPGGQ